ncbi:MAG: xanthine/uracil permease, partial [Proteobacteria bacterium]|nr:xanthine/uracil permease [Pseudomonadota bacterium]
HVWIRLSAISIGLLAGILVSWWLGMIDVSGLDAVDAWFLPVPWRYPLAVDWQVVALIMPIFLVSAMESLGDITATNNLSGLETGTPDYWLRIRGGIMAGGFNSLIAAIFCTFPNTTFSQNNGVIRLTGVSSRYVGNYVAAMLVVLGCLPLVAALFQVIPSVVVFGATLLMFMLVAFSGFRVVELSHPGARDWAVVVGALVLGYVVSIYIDRAAFLSSEVIMVLQFPVSTGAMLAIILEFLVPGRPKSHGP